ncbi:ABC transporter substrate-binding protein [Phaeacidiphilus oryzae]|uniref:ABC transporter substrate-binding protein n=1 Tax=Phaeacidiphilus oryzae TaxID=348818 RepID=UPI00055A4B69|nr:sugar ABC transporter substrate-binding protein [Phaeacidiphilus oryzae]
MRTRIPAVAVGLALLSTGLVACGGGSSGGGSAHPKTLTYWASNQGTSIQNDQQILTPELKKFTQQTGIKVNLEVIPWPDLLNRILTATSSGNGPDVLNIGNTWSASLAATGAFQPFDQATLAKIGGKDKFVPSTLTATGASGQTPDFVPLYGLAYGLFYNKKMFAQAGIASPPTTWEQLVADAKRLTNPAKGQYGVTVEGASYTENAHFAFMFGKQHGASVFDGSKPAFDSAQMVAGVKQYLDLMSSDKVVNPADAEYSTDPQVFSEFANNKAAMVMFQGNAENSLTQDGMVSGKDYGVVPIPFPSPMPAGGQKVNSHIAGINIGVFKNSGNEDGALKLVKFLTSQAEQTALNAKYHTLPVVTAAYSDKAFQTPDIKVFQQVLAQTAQTMPMIAQESQFETTVGTALKSLMADAATGKTVSDADIKAKLSAANQQMATGG